MPTSKRRIGLTVDDETFAKMERYRNERHLMSISSATMELAEIGFNALMEEIGDAMIQSEYENLEPNERRIVDMFRSLRPEAQRIALTTMESFAGNPAMQKEALEKSAM